MSAIYNYLRNYANWPRSLQKMYMKYGLQAVWPKDGNMVPKEMMHFVPIPVWCLMRNCPKRKKITTAGQPWRL